MSKAIGNIAIYTDKKGVRVRMASGAVRHEATGEDISVALIKLADEIKLGYERAKFAAEA